MAIANQNSEHEAFRERQIQIKQAQLKIAQESNMPLVAESIQRQLEDLQAGKTPLPTVAKPIQEKPSPISSPSKPKRESDFQALMSLLDD